MTQTVGLVGHCGFDSSGLKRLVKDAFGKDAKAVRVNDEGKLASSGCTLLLVNRVLDGRFESENGIELIRAHAAKGGAVPAMLVSNYADAQASAIEAGGLAGFGKSDLREEATIEKLRAAVSA